MKQVLTLACLLAVAHYVTAQCATEKYSETFIPQCAPKDRFIKWPNYENVQTFYQCQAVNKSLLVNCPSNQYFCYVLQSCVSCADYIPAVQCSQLKTQNTPNCVPIGENGSTGSPGGTTLPTPIYPNDTTIGSSTTKTTTTKTTTTKTTKSTAVTEPTPSMPTPPTEGPGGSTVPPPPSPVTNNPNIPMPPTPAPTPPSIPVTPPAVQNPPVG